MLMSIGPFAFDLVVNADTLGEEATEDFARKDIIGSRKPFEHVGAGDDRFTIRGALFPDHLGGGDAVQGLVALMRTGMPQLLLRGDGRLLGWVVMTNIRTEATHLDGRGRPGQVTFEIECMACDQPSAAGHLGALLSL